MFYQNFDALSKFRCFVKISMFFVLVSAIFNEEEQTTLKPVAVSSDVLSFTRRSLASNWFEDDRVRIALQGFLMRMCLTYEFALSDAFNYVQFYMHFQVFA